MVFENLKFSISTTPLLILLLSCCHPSVQQTATGGKETLKKVIVNLSDFPEPFSNAKLPAQEQDGTNETKVKCYNLIGCYEEIPLMTLAQDPTKFKTEFRIYSRESETETLVVYEATENCLKSSNGDTCELYPYDLNTILNSPFRLRRRTVIIIGGYMSKAPSQWERSIKDLWLDVEDVNVIVLSWTDANSGLYNTAATNTRPVARQLTVLLYYLATLNRLNLFDDSFAERLYIVGHSLGAHIAGFVGQDLGGKIGRITGLEAAGPYFDTLHPRFRLDKSDAQLVDALHTNAGSAIVFESQYGTSLRVGHIDLYANDGKHQPGCKSDRLGCSHKKANAYYGAFLRHAIAMRNHLGDKDKPCYRLAAYASPSYEEFHNGSALIRNCPETVLREESGTLTTVDMNKCLIPIDYITWFSDYKEELVSRHGVSFDAPANDFYFYTSSYTDDQTDHYLIKLQANKGPNQPALQDTCDVTISIQMSNGLDNKFEIEKYQLVKEKDEFEIIVPFLSPNTITKYELAKLDSNDFYLNSNDTKSLVASLMKFLPTSITITGLTSSAQPAPKKKKKGVMGFFANLMSLVRSDDKRTKVECNLNVDSLTVQPLRRMHRHLVASYSSQTNDVPKIRVITGDENKGKLELETTKASVQRPEEGSVDLRLYIDEVLIGLHDDSIDPVKRVPSRSLADDDSEIDAAGAFLGPDSSNVSPRTWLALTVAMFVVIIIMILISVVTRGKIADADKLPIIDEQML